MNAMPMMVRPGAVPNEIVYVSFSAEVIPFDGRDAASDLYGPC